MALDPARTVAELRELQSLTGNDEGAQRVAWTETWATARAWMRDKLSALPVEVEVDEAGNQWATLPGGSTRAVLIGGHIDSVPNGGWLDGCLNVLAGLEVLRRLAEEGEPPITVRLVDWADEEGARFGRSLFGSSACAGTMTDQDRLRELRDASGVALPDALAAHGVVLDRVLESGRQLDSAAAYLELHIEQGPVLESLDLPLGAVLGTFGVERHRVTFQRTGGSCGLDADGGPPRRAGRRGAARAGDPRDRALDRRRRRQHHGSGYDEARHRHGRRRGGRMPARPASPRRRSPRRDACRRQGCERALRRGGAHRRRLGACLGDRADPLRRDAWSGSAASRSRKSPALVHRLPSGPLHDAAEVCRAGVPTVMLFVQSLRGLSHTKLEDTREEHLELSVRALDRLASKTIAWVAGGGGRG